MTGLQRRVQRSKRRGFALALGAVFALTIAASPTDGWAAPEDVSSSEVVAARELFREGTLDFDAERYEAALAKFRRVADVRETGPVRFNIAQCEEKLDRLASALADYELAVREASPDASGEEIRRLARERAEALRQRVPRILVTVQGPAAPSASVLLDGTRISQASVGVALPVDAGRHTVNVVAEGYSPAEREATVTNGEVSRVDVELTRAPGLLAQTPGPRPLDDQPATTTSKLASDPAPPSSSGGLRTAGVIVLGVGAALGAGSIAFLASHNGAVRELEEACPGGRCPASRRDELNAKHTSATRDATLSVVFGAGGIVAAGVGALLLVLRPSSTTLQNQNARVTVGAASAFWGVSASGRF